MILNMKNNREHPDIIAVCGKGGVGKTCLSAMMTKILAARTDKKILVIDADPAVGLATSLGLTVKKTVNDIRNDIIDNIKEGDSSDKEELISMIDYEFLNAMEEQDNFVFLAIGRPEDEGCYCQLNTFLKSVIKELSDKFDYVLIDCEAGIEQVNRRVIEMVTHLVLITDPTAKGCNVATAIAATAKKIIPYEKIGLVINRVRKEDEIEKIQKFIKLPVIGYLPEDENIHNFDLEGKSFFDLPDYGALISTKKIIDGFISSRSINNFSRS